MRIGAAHDTNVRRSLFARKEELLSSDVTNLAIIQPHANPVTIEIGGMNQSAYCDSAQILSKHR